MINKNVSLKDFSNYKIGGNALYFSEVKIKEELIGSLNEWKNISKSISGLSNSQVFVLGSGTNILFSDVGFNGLIIKNSINGIQKDGNKVSVGAGTEVSKLTDFCIQNLLSGLEWAGGLPGTVGGAIRGNAGAFGGETKDNLIEATSLNLKTLETITRTSDECKFSYRNSIFKNQATDEIIISAVFNLEKGNREEIENKLKEKIEYRKAKHPLEYPNIGSTFKNVPVEKIPVEFKDELSQYIKNDPFPVIPAAKLIFLGNLKGKRVGDVMVSEKHTNFIINLGNGKASQVKELIGIIKNEIKNKFGVVLEEEIMYVGPA